MRGLSAILSLVICVIMLPAASLASPTFFFHTLGRAGPLLVQRQSFNATTANVSGTLSAAVQAGSTLIACFTVDRTVTSAISDNKSNTWTVDVSYLDTGGGTSYVNTKCAHASNVAGGSTTVTITSSGTVPKLLSVLEVSGLAASSTFDRGGSSVGTGTTLTATTSAAVSQSCEYTVMYGIDWNNYNNYTPSAGYTIEDQVLASSGKYLGVVMDNNVRTGISGTVSGSITRSTAGSWEWVVLLATYKCN